MFWGNICHMIYIKMWSAMIASLALLNKMSLTHKRVIQSLLVQWPQILLLKSQKSHQETPLLYRVWCITKSSCMSGADTISLMAHCTISQQLIKTLLWFSPRRWLKCCQHCCYDAEQLEVVTLAKDCSAVEVGLFLHVWGCVKKHEKASSQTAVAPIWYAVQFIDCYY